MNEMVTLEYLLSFIDEDAPYGDLTTSSIIGDCPCTGSLVARQDGTIAGLKEASLLFSHHGVDFFPRTDDGFDVSCGFEVAALKGSAAGALLVERTALNIIGRMSGIASRTRYISNLISSHNLSCRIAATRKTAPGLRLLDKKAVTLGGGIGHRLGLSDGILIKDNHLALVGLKRALQLAKRADHYRKIEVEVENPAQALQAAISGAEILLLDNMEPEEIRAALRLLEEEGIRERVLIEISGGIDESNILDYAMPGIDIISMGCLTHSVKNFDISLELFPIEK